MSQKTIKMIRKIFGVRAGYVLDIYKDISLKERASVTQQMRTYLSSDNKEELLKQFIKTDTQLPEEVK